MSDAATTAAAAWTWLGARLALWTSSAFDAARFVEPWIVALVGLGLVMLALCVAWLMQARLNRRLRKRPDGRVSIALQEVLFSLPALLISPLLLTVWLVQGIAGWARRRRREKAEAAREGDDDEHVGSDDEPDEPDVPLIVASLGPSFFLAGLVLTGICFVGWAVQPVLRSQLDLPPGAPVWQVLTIGNAPALQFYLPLSEWPRLNLLVQLGIWGWVWWQLARVIRLRHARPLGSNLSESAAGPEPLRIWRDWFAASRLAEPDASYAGWSRYAVASVMVLLVIGALGVLSSPYRVDATLLSAAVWTWTGWLIHLTLRGIDRGADAPAARPQPAPDADPPGWPEVLEHLRQNDRLHAEAVGGTRRPLAAPPMAHEDTPSGAVSPLLAELLPEDADSKLTTMQQQVLVSLALQGFVDVPVPEAGAVLSLGRSTAQQIEDRSGLTHRNQLVLSPGASGKSTLAELAAYNHVLTHAQAVLFVVRDEVAAARTMASLHRRLEASTMRWNLRVRGVGSDLVDDMASGVLPDIVVCSVRHLILDVLASAESYNDLLTQLGLVIVDDVDTFSGPIEAHAQLAFRRLTWRMRSLHDVRQLGEDRAPLVLVLGAETMFDMPAWVRALCGVSLTTRRFTLTDEHAAGGIQHCLGLHDLAQIDGQPIGVDRVVAACEAVGAPWMVVSSDGDHLLAEQTAWTSSEPRYRVSDPADAAVLLLDGSWADLRWLTARMVRAGWRRAERFPEADAGTPTTALISVVDSDEETALETADQNAPTSGLIDALPRALLRAPTGSTRDAHLGAELTQSWMELADLVEIYGASIAMRVRELASEDLLTARAQTELHDSRPEYVEHVHVRALQAAIDDEGRASRRLPPMGHHIDVGSTDVVTVRDRTTLTCLASMDALLSLSECYRGRVFHRDGQGYVVLGHLGELAGEDAPNDARMGDVLVEPYSQAVVSSPRRRLSLEPSNPADLAPGVETLPRRKVWLGREPIDIDVSAQQVRFEHIATYMVHSATSLVVQRTLFSDAGASTAGTLPTAVLRVFPNLSSDGERLTLAEARVLVAAMRSVLPSLYRGGRRAVALGLVVSGRPDDDAVLGADDAIAFYDLHRGGNGACQAIARDGLEPLLRLARLVLERVLALDRLLARHDHWGDEQTLRNDSGEPAARRGAGQPIASIDEGADVRREQWERWRQGALAWLDAHLRPEHSGGSAYAADWGSGAEAGEGDVVDLGRVWSSASGSVRGLRWTRHDWPLWGDTRASIDVAFDRPTATDAALRSTRSADMQRAAERLEEERASWTGGTVGAWHVAGRSESAVRTDDANAIPAALPFARLWAAMLMVELPALSPILGALPERFGQPRDDVSARRIWRAMVGWTSGIAPDDELMTTSLIAALHERRATPRVRAAVGATLLHAIGRPCGVFVETASGRTGLAVALDHACSSVPSEPDATSMEPDDIAPVRSAVRVLTPDVSSMVWAHDLAGTLFVGLSLDARTGLHTLTASPGDAWAFVPVPEFALDPTDPDADEPPPPASPGPSDDPQPPGRGDADDIIAEPAIVLGRMR